MITAPNSPTSFSLVRDGINKHEADDMAKIASKSLGDSTSYAVFTDKFDPTLLNPMPRAIARESHGIKGDEFKGVDIWNCHEATFLLGNGLPIAGTLKFVYNADSEYMVESKSAKLYLNSFDMCKMGVGMKAAIENYEGQVKEDLQRVLKTGVDVKFFSSQMYKNAERINPLAEYEDLVEQGSWDDGYFFGKGAITSRYLESMVFDDYTGSKNHIEVLETGNYHGHSYFSNALRSRCRHTKQKDTGLAAIAYGSTKIVAPPSILKQIVSLREVNEFHEFCAEKLFVEIQKHLNPEERLSVFLLYSRRGSLDINPLRWQGGLSDRLTSATRANVIVEKTQGQ